VKALVPGPCRIKYKFYTVALLLAMAIVGLVGTITKGGEAKMLRNIFV